MLKMEDFSDKKRWFKIIDFKFTSLLIGVGAFFISRAVIMEDLTPFGISFLAAYILTGQAPIIIGLSIILGSLSFHGLGGMAYIILVLILLLASGLIGVKKITPIKVSLGTGLVLIIIKSIFILTREAIIFHDFFSPIFEGLVIFTLTYIFSYGISKKSLNKIYPNERLIYIFLILALVLSGLHSFTVFNVSIKNIFSILAILVFAHKKGAHGGASLGLALGMVSYMSQPEMPFIIGLFGLGGLVGGVFRDLGRAGTILGFYLGNAIISFYINGYGISFLKLKELIAATLLFLILYESINNYILKNLAFSYEKHRERNYSDKKEEMTIEKLEGAAKVFKELGQVFKWSLKGSSQAGSEEIYDLIDDVANSVCGNCGMHKFCWGEGFYTTYYSLLKMVNLLEEKIPLSDENIPKQFKDYCIHKDEVKKELQSHFARVRITNEWKKKIMENRQLVWEQLEGLSNILTGMVKDIYIKPVFNNDLEASLRDYLIGGGVDIRDVMVAELDNERLEIYLEVERPYKPSNDIKKIKELAGEATGLSLKEETSLQQAKGGVKRFKLVKNNRFSVLTEVIKRTNSNRGISGDSYTVGEKEDSYYIGLSDGMGAGIDARNESKIAVALFEKLLEARFDKRLALKTINSVLMLKSNEEVFTTLDLSLIDLYSGKLQVVKTGAPPTFIRKKDKVEVINHNSLPVGIVDDVDIKIYEQYLEDGDIIIMMTDGILEANEKTKNLESWMKNIIENTTSMNPKKIAKEIMEMVDRVSENKVRDDMTLLVTKIWKTI